MQDFIDYCEKRLEKHNLFTAHKMLIEKVTIDSSWRTFLNILNCSLMIKHAGKTLECADQICLRQIIERDLIQHFEHFDEFIDEIGGFEDIIDYKNHFIRARTNRSESNYKNQIIPVILFLITWFLFSQL